MQCPWCGERRSVEWDAILRRWICGVCAKAWRPSTIKLFEN